VPNTSASCPGLIQIILPPSSYTGYLGRLVLLAIFALFLIARGLTAWKHKVDMVQPTEQGQGSADKENQKLTCSLMLQHETDAATGDRGSVCSFTECSEAYSPLCICSVCQQNIVHNPQLLSATTWSAINNHGNRKLCLLCTV
jgi:hypothetical protein